MSELKAWNSLKKGVLFFKGQDLYDKLEELETAMVINIKDAEGNWRMAEEWLLIQVRLN